MMVKKFKLGVLILVIIISGAKSTLSQTLNSGERLPAPSPREKRTIFPSQGEKERIRKRISLIKMWRLTEELNLDEETGAKFFPIIRHYEERRRELAKRREGLLQTLKVQLRAGKLPEDKIRGMLKEWDAIRTEEQELNRKEREDLEGILSLEQQARYLIFQHEFLKEMRRMIADVREKRFGSLPPRLNLPSKP